jgi:hypothetical protein
MTTIHKQTEGRGACEQYLEVSLTPRGATVSPIEISVKGKWITVRALNLGNKAIITRGKALKIAMIHDESWMDTELEDPDVCVRELKDRCRDGLRADIFTFAQKVPGAPPQFPYLMEWDSVAAASTTSFKQWWEKLPQETRKNVRRSQKRGVRISVQLFDDQLVKAIADVHNESTLRQGQPNVHYGKTLEQIKKDHSAFVERSDFICAYLGTELIGFLKLVHRGDVASILNLATKTSHYDKRPANALVAKAVELCEAKKVRYLTYGLFNYGNKRDNPLREFKSRNGFEEVLTPRFYIPLTTWGMLCMKLKFHRGLLGVLPHNVIMLGVGARLKWYTFKRSMSRCSSMLERPNRTRQMGRSTPPAGSNSSSR